MDGVSLDGILSELRLRLLGRYIRRATLAAEHLLSIEVSGERETRLLLDAARHVSCIGLVPRVIIRDLTDDSAVSGRQRHALLSLRKHVEGRRIGSLERIAGERTLILSMDDTRLAMRISGSIPALTLIHGDSALATLGEGPPVWPLPPARPEREWDRVDLSELARIALTASPGRMRARAILSACPSLGPTLAADTDGTLSSLRALRERLRKPRPTLALSCPLTECKDADLTAFDAVILLPIPIKEADRFVLQPDSWLEAAAILLELKRRGRRFERKRCDELKAARREIRRLEQLRVHLDQDLSGLTDPTTLRHQAEALLAWMGRPPPNEDVALIPDPRSEGSLLRVKIVPRLSVPRNANHLYERARRIERAREQLERRLAETRAAIIRAHDEETRAMNARNQSDLNVKASPPRSTGISSGAPGGTRRYLTSRGLTLLVGRGARANHRLTFETARPNDYWLHVRDAAGAHVILRDPENRAENKDLREAAEVAAYFSDLREAAGADVHIARRKHLRSAGAPGRVRIAYSETLRVVPSDPDGHLRRK